MASQIPQATGETASLRTRSSTLSHAKNPTRKMRCGRVFTACEPETQGLFTALCTETYPGFSHACCHVFHEPADRVFTACEHRTQWVVHSVMHRSVPGFVTGLSPAFARAWQSLRVVRRTRSQMSAPPWSYDLRLHRSISDFSTGLSPALQPVVHNLSTDLSTGCSGHCEDRQRRSNPGSSAWAGSTENGSGALIPASGSRKHRAAYDDECNARIKTPARACVLPYDQAGALSNSQSPMNAGPYDDGEYNIMFRRKDDIEDSPGGTEHF